MTALMPFPSPCASQTAKMTTVAIDEDSPPARAIRAIERHHQGFVRQAAAAARTGSVVTADAHWAYASMTRDMETLVPWTAPVSGLGVDERHALGLLVVFALHPVLTLKGIAAPGCTTARFDVDTSNEEAASDSSRDSDSSAAASFSAEGRARVSVLVDWGRLVVDVDPAGNVTPLGAPAAAGAPLNLLHVSPLYWAHHYVCMALRGPGWGDFWRSTTAVVCRYLDRGVGVPAWIYDAVTTYTRAEPVLCRLHGVRVSQRVRLAPDGYRGFSLILQTDGRGGDAERTLVVHIQSDGRLPNGASVSPQALGDYLEERHPHCEATADRMVASFITP